ncbi:MAG TPA: hypothetical protein VEU96_07385 [Bryobacteraceae bacterium]|nr:hypothetical protein [Bryobacteraceae bacterium]
MPASKTLPKLEAIAAVGSFALIFVAGLVGRMAIRAGMDEKTAGVLTRCGILLLFFIFGFSCIGLMIHVFIVLQTRIGNAAVPMVRFMADHETGVTVAAWSFLGLGTIIALPFMLQDMVGLKMPLGRSRGVLVADIGMTIDEARTRSTLKFDEPRHMGDGSWLGVRDLVFDFQIANSAVQFPQSRYYWMETDKNDRHIKVLNIGITPRKMPMPELLAFQHKLQTALFADGWMPGHYVAGSEETVRMWGGKRTIEDGRFWARGNTLLIFEKNRMDEEKRDEPPGSGEYILYIHMKPKSDEKNKRLVFERSAWEN